MSVIRALRNVIRDESGISMAEYGIIAVALTIPIIAAGYALMYSAGNALSGTGTQLTTIGTNPP